jgi:hypothetical protein
MRNNKFTIPVLAALIIAVISMGVAFAAFSATLTINGSAEIEASSWDIYFTNAATNGVKPSTATPVPSANIYTDGTARDLGSTYVATTFTWDASFRSPGDYIRYTIYVKNGGDYDAHVVSFNTPSIQCSSDPQHGCSHLHYGLYTNTDGTSPLDSTFRVNAGQTGTLYLIVNLDDEYGSDNVSASIAGLVSSDVTTNPISISILFEQVGGAQSNSGNQGGGSGSGSGGGQVASAEYNITGNSSDWVSLADLSTYMPEGYENVSPAVYFKRVNNTMSLCQVYNSTEYCIESSSTAAQIQQICNSLSSIYNDYGENLASNIAIGCTGYSDETDSEIDFGRTYEGENVFIHYGQDGLRYDCSLDFANENHYCIINEITTEE